MRFLIFNWKDIKHPFAGGAELATHQIAKHLISFGHGVTLISSGSRELSKSEIIDKVRIYRVGNSFTVYLWAVLLYLTKLRSSTDIIIDEFHGIPFYTIFFAKKPVVGYIHEVAGHIWDYEFGSFISWLGKTLEQTTLRIYKKTPMLVASQSTRKELMQLGYKKEQLLLLQSTINPPPKLEITKNRTPLFVYIGRLTPMKRIEMLIKVSSMLTKHFPTLKVFIAGPAKPTFFERLSRLIDQHQLSHIITLNGKITESLKWHTLAKAWLFVHPSIKEGFGLTVLEAAYYHTPTVCFDTHGLRGIVKNGYNGAVIKSHSLQALYETLKKLLHHPQLFNYYAQNAYETALRAPDWKSQTKKLEAFISRNLTMKAVSLPK